MKKLLALLLLLGNVVLAQQTAGTTALDPNQIYTTGNVVLPTVAGTNQTPWVNGVYQDQLTCWAWGNPGNCGPNPTVRPGNYINYSFGYTDLYQVQAIASILPTTGLRVNGYNFGFTAKNGNGWDDGRLDQLNAYVAFYGTDGKVKDYTNYNLNSQFNWTTFNYTKDFVTPYADKDLSTVQYGFTGKDNNFWAGTYGPEIMNVNFSLKYSVDACAVNVLSSPTCPGYAEALLKSIPTTTTPTTTTDPITTTTVSAGTTTTTTIVTDPVASVNTTTTTAVGQPSVVAPVVSAPAPVATSSTSTATASSSSSSSSSSSTAQASKESSPAGGGNVSLALSIISKNSERDAAGSAVAQSAVSQAQQAANQAQQEAQSVAANAVSNSLSANAVSTNGQQSSGNGIKVNNNNSSNFTLQSGQTSIASLVSGSQTTSNTLVQQQSSNTSINIMNSQPVVLASVNTQQSSVSTFALPLLQPQQPMMNAPIASFTQTEQQVQIQTLLQNNNTTTQSIETYSLVPPNFLTDKSNPLTDIIEGKQNIPQNNTTASTGPSVNKNASDNELAGGIDINRMALAPAGYGSYLNLAMRDAAFYAPKEVYRNQVNVDNARLLRLMTNDSKHREMVEMQYAK